MVSFGMVSSRPAEILISALAAMEWHAVGEMESC